MAATSAMAFLLRPLLAALDFAPTSPATSVPAIDARETATVDPERAAALREAEAHDERIRRNLWLAALGNRRSF